MTVGSELSVNGPGELKVADDSGRAQVEDLVYRLSKLFVGHLAGAVGIYHNGDGTGNADCVGKLNKALICKACRDDVLGNIAGRVGRAAVYLSGILA